MMTFLKCKFTFYIKIETDWDINPLVWETRIHFNLKPGLG